MKNKSIYTCVAISTGAALLLFACLTRNWSIDLEIFLYGTAFAASFMTVHVCTQKALHRGPLAFTSMANSFSLVLPTLYGILFLREDVTPFFVAGLFCILLAIVLTSNVRYVDTSGVRSGWLFCVVLSFFGNGMCSIVQRMGQAHTENVPLMMVVAFGEVFLMNLLLAFWKEGLPAVRKAVKQGGIFAIFAGLGAGLMNLLVILMNTRVSASFLFPLIGGIALLIHFLASVLYYKERFTKIQLAGFLVSILGIVLIR